MCEFLDIIDFIFNGESYLCKREEHESINSMMPRPRVRLKIACAWFTHISCFENYFIKATIKWQGPSQMGIA